MKASNALNMILAVLLAMSNFYSQTESETSYTWKLDAGIGKIMPDTIFKAALLQAGIKEIHVRF